MKLFLIYKSRYSSQSTTNPYYFSYDYGFAHFLHFTTEFYYYPQFVSENRIADQYDFIKNDLKSAQKNRKNVPWIIVTGHRPMYCQVQRNFKLSVSQFKNKSKNNNCIG